MDGVSWEENGRKFLHQKEGEEICVWNKFFSGFFFSSSLGAIAVEMVVPQGRH